MGGAYPLRQCAVMDKEEQKHMDRVEEARRTLLALYGGSHSPLEESDPDFAAIKQRLSMVSSMRRRPWTPLCGS